MNLGKIVGGVLLLLLLSSIPLFWTTVFSGIFFGSIAAPVIICGVFAILGIYLIGSGLQDKR